MGDKRSVRISPAVYPVAAIALVAVPMRWLGAWCLAALFHELCHYVVLKLFRIPIYGIHFGPNGAKIYMPDVSNRILGVCAIAGPIGGLMLVFLGKWFPRTAVCAFVQSVFNLLPILPFDGGRCLLGFVSLFTEENTAHRICSYIGNTARILIGVLCVYLLFRFSLGIFLVLLILWLFVTQEPGKTTCNQGLKRVQ